MSNSSHKLSPRFRSLRGSLKNDVFGQRRTSKNKQHVVLHGDYVYKGPHAKGSKRLTAVLYRSKILREWKGCYRDSNIILPVGTEETDEGVFVKYPNIAKDDEKNARRDMRNNVDNSEYFEWHTEGWDNGRRYRVLKRSNVIKLSDAMKRYSREDVDFVYDNPALITDMVLLWVLHTGDTGLNNILANVEEKKIYVIDYDDTRGKDRDGYDFYFVKSTPEKYEWRRNICHYDSARESVECVIKSHRRGEFSYDSTIDENEIYSRLKDARKYLYAWTSGNDSEEEIDVSSHGNRDRSRPSRSPNVTSERCDDVGKMKYNGPYRSITYSGHNFVTVKSALQKYIRRGITVKARMAAIEMWRMIEDDPKAKGLVSNLYNRLAVIATEDIGPANRSLMTEVVGYVNGIKRDDADRSAEKLIGYVDLMCESKKTRVMSHIWCAYATKDGRTRARKAGLELDRYSVISDSESMDDIEKDLDDDEYIEKIFAPNDPDDLREIAKVFYHRLKYRDYNAAYWLAVYLKVSDKRKVSSRNRRTQPAVLLWEVLRYFIDSRIWTALSTAYYVQSEKRPFIMSAVVLSIYRPREGYSKLSTITKSVPTADDIDVLVSGRYVFELDGYVKDMHTPDGGGKGKKEFVKEGAIVNNEDPRYHLEDLKGIYEDL